jgi:uncharacterized protein (TIGR00369 family)
MMSIWKKSYDSLDPHRSVQNTMVQHLGIQITRIGDDYLEGTMPVDHRTCQPYGILHGGASVTLAESIGSLGAHMAADPGHRVVGLEINANHIRRTTSGTVTGIGRPVHIGRTTQVWQIEIVDEDRRLVCISRLTIAVMKPSQDAEQGRSEPALP